MQFSFAFSGKLHRVSISSGNRPRYTKCVSILSSEGFGCRLIDSLLIISDRFSFVKNFLKLFSKFLKQSFQNSNFSDRRLFRNSLFIISNRNPFVKNFFILFKPLFRSTAAPLSDSFNRIPQGEAQSQALFSKIQSEFLRTRLITKAAMEKATLTADNAHATISTAILFPFRFLFVFFIFYPLSASFDTKDSPDVAASLFSLSCFIRFTSSAQPEA